MSTQHERCLHSANKGRERPPEGDSVLVVGCPECEGQEERDCEERDREREAHVLPELRECGFHCSYLQIYVGGHEEDDAAVFVLDRVVVAKLGSVEVDNLAIGDWEGRDYFTEGVD